MRWNRPHLHVAFGRGIADQSCEIGKRIGESIGDFSRAPALGDAMRGANDNWHRRQHSADPRQQIGVHHMTMENRRPLPTQKFSPTEICPEDSGTPRGMPKEVTSQPSRSNSHLKGPPAIKQTTVTFQPRETNSRASKSSCPSAPPRFKPVIRNTTESVFMRISA